MTTIIYRNSFIFKTPPPPEVAYYVREHTLAPLTAITWADVMKARREKQARILRNKRGHSNVRAVRVHVRYFNTWVYMGWHTYIEGVNFSQWIKQSAISIPQQVMDAFPVLEPLLFPRVNPFEDWMEAFAEQYKRGTFHGKPRGVAYAWAEVENGSHVRKILRCVNEKEVHLCEMA